MDGINARSLRILPSSALELMAQLFDLANTGDVPHSWKQSEIVPLPKPGKSDYNDPKSWRPVAITSMISRTWERVVALRLEAKMSEMLRGVQYAYRRNRSATALLRCLRTTMDNFLNRKTTVEATATGRRGDQKDRHPLNHHILFLALDCTAAFNAANIDKILENLTTLKCNEIQGVQSWLGNQTAGLREQRLRSRSTFNTTTSGVPQGSVLGPILWLAYIDPIVEELIKAAPNNVFPFSAVFVFADDISIMLSGPAEVVAEQFKDTRAVRISDFFAPRNTPNTAPSGSAPSNSAPPGAAPSGCNKNLKAIARTLGAWSSKLSNRLTADGIQVSSTKTTVHHLAGDVKNAQTPEKVGPYTVTTNPVKLVGMTFDNNLGVKHHQRQVVAECSRLLGRLRAVAPSLSPDKVRTLYSAYILPKLSYAASSYVNLGWNAKPPLIHSSKNKEKPLPTTCHFAHADLDELERIHNEACRIISGTYTTTQTEYCLREAGFRSLKAYLSRITTREDEVAFRMGKDSFSGIAPTSNNCIPVLRCLPYEPSWAGEHCDMIRFFFDHSPTGKLVTNKSPKKLLRAENDWRLAQAIQYVGDTYKILGTDGAVLSNPKFPHATRAAGAAVLANMDQKPFDSATKAASEGACSYTAECRGGEAGLELVNKHTPLGDDTPVIWVTDSRSLVEALAKGCLLQTGYAEAHMWKSLLDLASRGVKVAIVWVFSHTETKKDAAAALSPEPVQQPETSDEGCKINAEADKLAGEAVRQLEDLESINAPWWYVDAARARYRKVYIDYDNSLTDIINFKSSKVTVTRSIRYDSDLRTLAPLRLSVMRFIAPRLQRVLSCLRSLVWQPLGIAENKARQCVCNEVLFRDKGIHHLFTCTHPEVVRIRPHFASMDALWSYNINCLQAIAIYAVEFKRLLSQRGLDASDDDSGLPDWV